MNLRYSIRSLLFATMLIGSFCALLSCGEEETCFRCLYEKRVSSCNSYSYGPWEAGEITEDLENIKSGLSKEDYCNQVYPASDSHCAGGCCLNFQFQNVRVASCN